MSGVSALPLQAGRIELIVGPMFAGKTTELQRRVRREIHAHRSCFIIKYSKDVRYSDNCVATHEKQMLRAAVAATMLSDVGTQWKMFDCIAIDEGQFFPDLLAFCAEVADAGKTVIVSALDGDFQRKPFGKVCELLPLCESVTKLTAVCMICHAREAVFTRRTVACSQQELIGGADMYLACCRQCFNCPPPSPRKIVRAQREIEELESAVSPITPEPAAKKQRSESPPLKRQLVDSPP